MKNKGNNTFCTKNVFTPRMECPGQFTERRRKKRRTFFIDVAFPHFVKLSKFFNKTKTTT